MIATTDSWIFAVGPSSSSDRSSGSSRDGRGPVRASLGWRREEGRGRDKKRVWGEIPRLEEEEMEMSGGAQEGMERVGERERKGRM